MKKPIALLAGALVALSLAGAGPTYALADEVVQEQEISSMILEESSDAEQASDEQSVIALDETVAIPVGQEVVPDEAVSDDEGGAVAADDALIADDAAEESDDALTDEPETAEDTATEAPSGKEAQNAPEEASDEAVAQANDPTAQKELDALAAEHADDLPAGRYEIVSNANPAKTGDTTTYALDVQGNKKTTGSNTAAAILYSEGVKDNQRWDISYVNGGYALIKSVSTGQYLSLLGGDSAYDNGSAQVVLWDYKSGALWQQWVIIRQADSSFKLISALLKGGTEQRVLDVRGGSAQNSAKTIVYQGKTSGDANQRWTIRVTNDILDREAGEHKSDLPDGTYLIGSSAKKGLVLNLRRNSKENGAEIIVYPDTTVTVNDGWDIVHNEAGYVTIINSSSGKVLDVRGGKATNGATVFQWSDKQTGARNQAWIAMLEADGSYKFVSALAGDVRYVLSVKGTVKSGAAIQLQMDKGGSSDGQHWTIEQAPEQYAYAHAIADGTYLIRTALDATKVLDVSRNSKTAGAQVKLYTCKLSDNQYWTLARDNQGYATLKNKNSGLYLAFSTTKVDGSYVTVQSKTACKWVVEPTEEGGYVLREAKTGRCVDLSRSNTANGAKVIAYKATSGKNQQWAIAPATRIALDPGHGGNDSGATGNGMRECDLTWSITQSCAEQLRAYGFDVYLTIGENEFKNGATVSIADRVSRAAKAGCVAVFSMHINAGGGSGAVVLVPNSSAYHKEFYSMGQTFAKTLLTRVNALGIGTWGDGAWERNFTVAEGASEAQYYDGKGGLTGSATSYGIADYYGIVRYARLYGMFGVIIEHGFIDSSHDAAILRQTAAQAALGKADAYAIKALYV